VLLGDASYALYLSHIFTLGVLRKLFPPLLGEGPLAAWLFVILSLPVCVLVSILIHKYVDNWLLRHERLVRKRRQSPFPSKA
jgi:exopolysaccharide production protein ExoZ